MKGNLLRVIGLCVVLLLAPFTTLSAQYADEEYRMEVGGRLGGMAYMGDANYTSPFQNMEFSAGLMARYTFNSRMALKCDMAMGKITGDTRMATTQFPEGKQLSFERKVYDVSMQFEYKTKGTCSQRIFFEIEDGKVHNVQYLGGCNGNLQGIGRLVEGMDMVLKIEIVQK